MYHSVLHVLVVFFTQFDRCITCVTVINNLCDLWGKFSLYFFSLIDDDTSNCDSDHVSAADVVIIGLGTVVPLMTLELLKVCLSLPYVLAEVVSPEDILLDLLMTNESYHIVFSRE